MNRCRYAIGVWVLAALAGCGSLHVYDKGADDLATSIKSDYEAAKVADVIAAERVNINALEKKQLDVFVKTVQVERDMELISLLSDSKKPFVSRLNETIDARLLEITGSASAGLALTQILAIRKAGRELENAVDQEASLRGQLARVDLRFAKLPDCTVDNSTALGTSTLPAIQAALKSGTATFSVAVLKLYESYPQACADLLKSRLAVADAGRHLPGSLLATASDKLSTTTASLARTESDARAAKAALKDAAAAELAQTKAMAKAAEIPDATCPTAEEKDKPRTELCKAIGKLESLGDFGKKILSEEKINDINALLRARSGEYPADDEDVKAALLLVSTQARFVAARREYKASGQLPALEPLIIEKQLAAARLDLATKGVTLEKLRVTYRKDMYDALLEEAFLLLQARAQTGSIRTAQSCAGTATVACASMSQILQDPKLQKETGKFQEPAARSAYRALALVSESYSVARTRYQSAEMREILSAYQDSLNRSEASLAAWHALIVTPVNQLKTYYADGLKPADVAQLLQAAGLIGIAARIK